MKSTLSKPYEFEEYYQILIKEKYFDTMKDIYILATVLGFERGKHDTFSKSGGDPIKEHIFQDDDKNIMDIISVLSTGEIKILINENKDDKYKLIEEYANSGMDYLVQNIFNGTLTSVDKIVDFVMSYAPETGEQKVDLSDLFADLVDELEEKS